MKKYLKLVLISMAAGLLITSITSLVKGDTTYKVDICNSANPFESKIINTIYVHYKVAGWPWSFKDYEPENPVATTCPVLDNIYYGSPFSTNKAHFIEDTLVWSVLSFCVIALLSRRSRIKKHE